MTKQKISKIAEVVLVLAFCMVSIYITLVGTVFVGTPFMLTHQSINGIAQRLRILRPCIKKNGAVDGKLLPSPCSSEEMMRVVQMDEPPRGYET
jgi:hypothetical protein